MRRAGALLATVVLAGCGLGEGEERGGGAELRVTREFGRKLVGAERVERVRSGQTVMRLLRSRFEVDTRFGGRFVQSIAGIEGGGPEGRRDWFYFVNGLEAEVGAAEYELSPGDVVHWDYRRWDGAMTVPAIVGAFPEPFVSGRRGKRFPARVECEAADSPPCRRVKASLRARGIKAAGSSLGAQGTSGVARVVVGRWPAIRLVQAAARLGDGPERSGVFARFRGRALLLLDAAGEPVRRAAPGTGLVAALAPGRENVVWVVTGLDAAGVERAARALEPERLRDAYAVAATAGRVEKLPVGTTR